MPISTRFLRPVLRRALLTADRAGYVSVYIAASIPIFDFATVTT
jgi:hypothetical protein